MDPKKFEYYFNLLYSVYSFPNIILPLFAGVTVIKFGLRPMYISISIIILLGQLLYSLGCQIVSFELMLFGRFVYGIGGESLNIAYNAMLVKWFFRTDVALPITINLSFNRLFSFADFNISPYLAKVY